MDLFPLFLSLKVAVIATLVTVCLGIPAAWFVARLKHGKGIIDGLLTLPMVLPPTVVGFFLLLFVGKHGLLGTFLTTLNISITFTWVAATFASIVVSFPLMYRTARGSFELFDQNLIFAGQTLGMSNAKIFVKIILPNTLPGMTAGMILSFARALGEFGATIMVAGNIPGRTQTMAVAIYSAVQSGDRATAYKWVAIILSLSLGSMILMNCFSSNPNSNNYNRKK